ncbi:hypothetical protein [Demequina sp.]|uniref:hypothetical protein n=1 Tax=Demequina sp. TaxID=2050685 RepID=UPI0025DD76C9|nr:hypothetical protein [Demequina sp.]
MYDQIQAETPSFTPASDWATALAVVSLRRGRRTDAERDGARPVAVESHSPQHGLVEHLIESGRLTADEAARAFAVLRHPGARSDYLLAA